MSRRLCRLEFRVVPAALDPPPGSAPGTLDASSTAVRCKVKVCGSQTETLVFARPFVAEKTSDWCMPMAMDMDMRQVGLQLYKVQEDSYLLDIRKVDGEVLPFMDVCSLLLGELKL